MNPDYDYNDFSGLTGEISTDIANRPYVNGNSGMPTYASSGVTYPDLSNGMILLSHVNSGSDGSITEFRFARTHSQSSKPKYYVPGISTNVFNTEVKFKTAMNSYPGDNANYVFKMELWGDNDRDSWLQITPSPLNGNKLHVDIAELVSDPDGDYGYGVGKGNWADGPFSGRTWRVCNKNTKVRSSDAADNWLEESAILADAATNNTSELALEWGTEYSLAISAVFSDDVNGDVITYTFKDAAGHILTSVSVGSWGDYYQVANNGYRTYVDSLAIQVRHEGDPSGPYKQPVLFVKSIAYGTITTNYNMALNTAIQAANAGTLTVLPGTYSSVVTKPSVNLAKLISPAGSDTLIKQSVDTTGSQANRPSWANALFYDTQGYNMNIDTVDQTTKKISIDLYIPAHELTAGRRYAGFWGVGYNPSWGVDSYPIIEFTSIDSSRFRCYGTATGNWFDMDYTVVGDKWYTLTIELSGPQNNVPGADPNPVSYYNTVTYTVAMMGGSSKTIVVSEGYVGGSWQDTKYIGNVILQAYNKGLAYDVYWKNLKQTKGGSTSLISFSSPLSLGSELYQFTVDRYAPANFGALADRVVFTGPFPNTANVSLSDGIEVRTALSSDEIVNLSTIGGNTIDLAGGNDKVVYNSASTDVTITFPTSNSCQVQLKNTEAPESDLLVNVELIQFSDKTIVVADARAGNNAVTVDGSGKVTVDPTSITTADAAEAAVKAARSAAASGGSANDALPALAAATSSLADNPAAYAAMIDTLQKETGGAEIELSSADKTALFSGITDLPDVVTFVIANADNKANLPSNPNSGFYCQLVPGRPYTMTEPEEFVVAPQVPQSVTVVYDNTGGDKTLTVTDEAGNVGILRVDDYLKVGNRSYPITGLASILLNTGRNVACFTAGMRILTPAGYRAVETLRKGDLVTTADGREVPAKVYSSSLKTTTTATAPYVIPAHSFGRNTPPAELRLSPLHAFQTKKNIWQIPKYANNAKVVQYGVGEPVTYYHLECPNFFRDNLVVEGCVVESFAAKQTAGIKTVYTPNTRLGGYTRITGPTAAAHTSR